MVNLRFIFWLTLALWILPRTVVAQSPFFSISDYGLPIGVGIERDPNWPPRLTFQPWEGAITSETLAGSWGVRFLCDGEAVSVDVLRRTRLYAGVSREQPLVRHDFDGRGGYSRWVGGLVDDLSRNPDDLIQSRDRTCRYEVRHQINSNETEIQYPGCRLAEGIYFAHKVRETGEIVFEQRIEREQCAPGRFIRIYYFRLSASTS